MIASAPDSSEARKPGEGDEAPQDQRGAFGDYFSVTERRRSRRHYGRFVGFAKLLLVSLAAALVVVLAVWPQLNQKDAPTKIGQSPDKGTLSPLATYPVGAIPMWVLVLDLGA